MKSLPFISKYLGVAPFKWRDGAGKALYENALLDEKAISQLKENLLSENLDIVENSLKVLFRLSYKTPERILSIKERILKTAKRCNHFKIAYLSKNILQNLSDFKPSAKGMFIQSLRLITPTEFVPSTQQAWYRYSSDHFVEYALGGADYKYKLDNICNAFKYAGKKGYKKLLQNMKVLGYQKGKKYWEDVPSRWSRGYSRNESYKTKLHYCAYHGIQIFLMWCIKNLPVEEARWTEFLQENYNYEPVWVEDLITDRPDFIKFKDVKIKTEVWLKDKLKRADIYNLTGLNQSWVVLYEDTRIRFEDKLLSRKTFSGFTTENLNKIKDKKEVFPPSYSCNNCLIDEVPMLAHKSKKLFVSDHNRTELDGKLFPAYGIISETNFGDSFNPVFPAPEMVEQLKLKQRKGTLEYYTDTDELVIKTINWQNGFVASIGNHGEDKHHLADHGSVLMIKGKYLKKFLKSNKLRLITCGDLDKSKIDRYGTGWEYKPEDTRRKRFIFEISEIVK